MKTSCSDGSFWKRRKIGEQRLCVFPVEEKIWLGKERVGYGHSHDLFSCHLSILLRFALDRAFAILSFAAYVLVEIGTAEYNTWFSKPLHLYLPEGPTGSRDIARADNVATRGT